MTFVYGEPDPYDPDFYASVGRADKEAYPYNHERRVREAFQLKRQQKQQQLRRGLVHASPPSRGALGWILNAPEADEAQSHRQDSKVPAQLHPHAYEHLTPSRRHDDEEQRRLHPTPAASGYAAPSIHTILDIVTQSTRAAYEVRRGDHKVAFSSPERSTAGAIVGVRPEKRSSSTSCNNSSPLTSTSESGTATPLPSFLANMELRRGKWTKAEEVYAAATIQYFCSGLLNLQFGTLLRGFLAQQLHCHPMRISKKLLPGTRFHGVEITRKLGRRAYSPRWCDSPQATHEKLEAEEHLSVLQAKFVASLEEEAQMLAEEEEESGKGVAQSAKEATKVLEEEKNQQPPEVEETYRKKGASMSPKMKEVQVVQQRVPGAAPPQHRQVRMDQKRARDEEPTVVDLQPQHHRRHHHQFQQSNYPDHAPSGWNQEQQRVYPCGEASSGVSCSSPGDVHAECASPARLVLPSLRESLERASNMF
ncbi:hypothetical protein FI667_g9945, partial [Globisporangium splendens]